MNLVILKIVLEFICQVIGEEWVYEIDIINDILFNVDLELESIEFVVLVEFIQEYYGE